MRVWKRLSAKAKKTTKTAPRRDTSPRVRAQPRKFPSQARSQETVQAIVVAAGRLLRSVGYRALTTQAIAEMAGVSIGSLYQYFPSKDAIVAELVMESHQDRTRRLFETLDAARNLPLAQAVHIIIRFIYANTIADPKLFEVISDVVPRVGRLAEVVEYVDSTTTFPLQQYLASRGREMGIKDFEFAAFMLPNILQPFLHRIAASPRLSNDPERVIRELTRLATGYLKLSDEDMDLSPLDDASVKTAT